MMDNEMILEPVMWDRYLSDKELDLIIEHTEKIAPQVNVLRKELADAKQTIEELKEEYDAMAKLATKNAERVHKLKMQLPTPPESEE